MFDFKVLGLSEAEVEIARKWPTLIVSAISLTHPLALQGDHHLIVDVEDVHVEGDGRHATDAMLVAILEHTRHLTSDDRLLVHCFAGQSRSTAIALAILIQHGLSAWEAFEAVKTVRPMMIPNQLFVRLIDERFALDGELIAMNNAHISAALRSTARTESVSPAQSAAMKKIMDLFG